MNLIPQLEAYRPRAAVTEGTWLEVKGGVRFLVKEPSDSNLAYSYRLLDVMEFDEETGEVKSKSAMNRAMRRAFAETCIVDCEGLDLSGFANGGGVPSFAQALPRILEAYPDLLTELFAQASRLAREAAKETEDALKNSGPPSPGD